MRRVQVVTVQLYVGSQTVRLPAGAEFLHVEHNSDIGEGYMSWFVDDELPTAVRVVYRTTDEENVPDEPIQHLASVKDVDGWAYGGRRGGQRSFIAHWWTGIPRTLTAADFAPQSSSPKELPRNGLDTRAEST